MFHNKLKDIFDLTMNSGVVEERNDEDKRPPSTDPKKVHFIFGVSYQCVSNVAGVKYPRFIIYATGPYQNRIKYTKLVKTYGVMAV